MKNLKLLIASMALTCFALFPAASLADEDLDVTMEVFDNLTDVEGVVLEMAISGGEDGGDGDDDRSDDHESDGHDDDRSRGSDEDDGNVGDDS